jgi:hypothetical protein
LHHGDTEFTENSTEEILNKEPRKPGESEDQKLRVRTLTEILFGDFVLSISPSLVPCSCFPGFLIGSFFGFLRDPVVNIIQT